ncbi:MAG TPA: thioesterase domain-containing protein [Ignavibacteria bacterium]|nr:thioesterase domain-containing protein [Ignavibacteria bacterium]
MIRPLKIFCLPYAGGNKYSYREFEEAAPSHYIFHTLDYPGRVPRIKEPLISDAGELVEDLFNQIKTKISDEDYVLYGHSMGGLLAYLLTRKLEEKNYKTPMHLIITGTSGPSVFEKRERKRHLMPQKEFIQEMKDLDGIPEEILDTEELMAFFEPILRSDFKVCENYVHKYSEPLNIPITVITGTEEDMEVDDILLWQKETNLEIDFNRIEGKHFFIFKKKKEVMEIIEKTLSVNSNHRKAFN